MLYGSNPSAAPPSTVRWGATVTGDAETFAINRSFAVLSKGAAWLLSAFVVLFVALPFLLYGDRPPEPIGIMALSVFGTCFFGGLGWYGFRIVKRLPYCAVSVDDEGLWPAHLSRDTALIRWNRVHWARERPFLQRLDLLDANGEVLMKLEYQLSGFEALRARVVENAQPPAPPAFPATYAKPLAWHVFHIACIAGFSLLGWYVGEEDPLLGYGGMAFVVALIVREYLATVSRLTLLRDRLRIAFPLRTRELARTQLQSAQIGDLFNQGSRFPEVGLYVRDERKPIRLRSLGVDAVTLQQTLERWREWDR